MRGNSEFESAIEYDNLSAIMDGRVTPKTLKRKRDEQRNAASQFNFKKTPAIPAGSGGNRYAQPLNGSSGYTPLPNQFAPVKQGTATPTKVMGENLFNTGQQPTAPAPGQNTQQGQSSALVATKANPSVAEPIKAPQLSLKLSPLVERYIKNEVFTKFPVNSAEKTRTQLPFLIDPKKKIDIIKLIKDSIGKDLTKIAMPAYMNEPLSMLQKLVEPFEYKELLDKAATVPDSALRLAYAMAYLFMPYVNTPLRMKKPFNPLLGETFDIQIDDLDVITEQVSHHPPISACFGKCKDYEVIMCTNIESSMGWKTFSISPKGGMHLFSSVYKDHMWVKQCKSYVYNLIFGTMDIQHVGEMTGKNFKTGDTISLVLNDMGGWNNKNASQANGKVVDRDGNLKYTLKADWKENPYFDAISPSGQVINLVRKKPSPENFAENYRFPQFSINANHVWKDLLYDICPTDCRLRPDTRALEHGNEDLAESEKKRLEEKQRAKRKQREATGEEWHPRWFKSEYDIDSSEEVYKYKGGYWERRKKRDWSGIDDLY